MLPVKFATPLTVERYASRDLLCFLAAIYFTGSCSIFLLDLAWWLKGVLLLFVFLGVAWALYSNSLYDSSFISTLIWTEHQWRLFNRNQGECYASLSKNWCIHPFFIVLEFVTDSNKKMRVFLCKDSIGRETFRVLSIRLRHSREGSI